jgi:hypothetical protein
LYKAVKNETFCVYDGTGRRVQKQDSGGQVNYVWDEDNVLWDTNNSGTLQSAYTYLPQRNGVLLSQSRLEAYRSTI